VRPGIAQVEDGPFNRHLSLDERFWIRLKLALIVVIVWRDAEGDPLSNHPGWGRRECLMPPLSSPLDAEMAACLSEQNCKNARRLLSESNR
jgi:hypothetical protein